MLLLLLLLLRSPSLSFFICFLLVNLPNSHETKTHKKREHERRKGKEEKTRELVILRDTTKCIAADINEYM